MVSVTASHKIVPGSIPTAGNLFFHIKEIINDSDILYFH